MKYICIKECCTLTPLLMIKQLFIVGQIYEFSQEPDMRYFKIITF
nr:MAG TPA: hypothetical protein [Caudoviricetes sp.]